MQAQYKICVSVIWGMQQRTKGTVNFQELAPFAHHATPLKSTNPNGSGSCSKWRMRLSVCASASAGCICRALGTEGLSFMGEMEKKNSLPDCPRNESPDHAHTNRITTITTTGSLSCWRGPLESKIFTHTKSGESPRQLASVCVMTL